MKTTTIFTLKKLELIWRFFTATYMFKYGYVKLNGRQFSNAKHYVNKTLEDLSGYELMWYFFGYSKSFIVTIGILQILGGTLLLFNKTKLLGVTILLPILLNIFLIDYFYGMPKILQALINAGFYLITLVLICYNERSIITNTFKTLIIPSKKILNLKEKLFNTVIIIAGCIITYLILNELLKKTILGIQYKSDYFNQFTTYIAKYLFN